MSERKLNDWLTSYMEFTQHSESPTSYHLWTGLSCISAALQRKLWMRWGHTTIYPNFYIVLVGPSGRARKGEPIDIGRSIIEEINIPSIGDDNTQEAVIRIMKRAESSFNVEGENPVFQSAVSCFTEELAVLTGYQNGTFLAYLTQWYDSRDKWSRYTKHQGIDKLIGVCFNLLASTAPDWLPHILTREAIGGGFTSRVIFVSEDRKGKTIADPNLYPPNAELRDALIYDLEVMHTISGEMKFSPDAHEAYVKWYTSQDDLTRSGVDILPAPIFDGYVSRRATHVKKIAISLSMAANNDRVITLSQFQGALSMLINAEKNMPKVFNGIGAAALSEETEMVLSLVRSKGKIRRSEILRQFYRDIDAGVLEDITKTLVQMGNIKSPKREGNDYIYEWSGAEP